MTGLVGSRVRALQDLETSIRGCLRSGRPPVVRIDHGKNSPVYPADGVDVPMPQIVSESGCGLETVSVEILEEWLRPVIESLHAINAEDLLSLKRVASGGAHMRDGIYVKPIHDDITPRCVDGTVRYVHMTEIPEQYSMGIFIFPPHAKIPLHDHPGMCVLSRVLYGDLHRVSLDLARHGSSHMCPPPKRTSWLSNWSNNSNTTSKSPKRRGIPDGSKLAYKRGVDYLSAPDCTALYPYEGNLHEFVAGPNGAAVLDVLLPPYDADHHRDCTFYRIEDCPSDGELKADSSGELCWIIPTGQPEDFHCISGTYKDMGT